jgi:hypothetical protein
MAWSRRPCVVASNLLGTVEGPDQTFTTQGAGAELQLLDNRAWEMVSPPDKHGTLIRRLDPNALGNGPVQASVGGSAITYSVSSPTEAEAQGNAGSVQVLSRRGPGGWSSQDISAPNNSAAGIEVGGEYQIFSSDLSFGVLQPFGSYMPLSPEASEQTPYLHTDFVNGDVGDPCQAACDRPLVTGAPGYADVPSGTVFSPETGSLACEVDHQCVPRFMGATPDLSHVVVWSKAALTSLAIEHGVKGGLYEWADGSLQLVSVLPDGQPDPGGAKLGSSQGGDAGEQRTMSAISDDGTRIVWAPVGSGLLYMRDVSKGETIQLGAGLANPVFQVASSDGSKVFFENGSDEGGALYECEMIEVEGKLRCKLSELAQVVGEVLGASEDGEYIYFVSNGVLAGGATPGDCAGTFNFPRGTGNTCNLYVYHNGVTTFIATLSGEDAPDFMEPEYSPAAVSPNGEWLTFMSQRDLTGYDVRDAVTGLPDEEVYLYNARTKHLVCPSCEPTGALPVGTEEGGSGISVKLVHGQGVFFDNQIAAWLPTATEGPRGWGTAAGGSRGPWSAFRPRDLSDSGRLFFDSFDALVPQDVDGTWDVYEYEPAGVGSCSASSVTFGERSTGCVGLISAGTSAEESAFMDASESGGDVFFLTGSRLVPQDLGSSLDVYDAHECTAQAPCMTAATVPPPCSTGDACKPAPTPQPALYGAPSSETFSGAGNVTPAAPSTAVAPRSASRAQKFMEALRACGKKPRKKRAVCEARARRSYGANKSRVGGRSSAEARR